MLDSVLSYGTHVCWNQRAMLEKKQIMQIDQPKPTFLTINFDLDPYKIVDSLQFPNFRCDVKRAGK